MAMTSLDHVFAGLKTPRLAIKSTSNVTDNRWKSSWGNSGDFGNGVYDTSLNGAVITGATVGSFQRENPASGGAYISEAIGALANAGSRAGIIQICDRLWSNQIDRASVLPQTIVMPAPAATRCPTSFVDASPEAGGTFLGFGTRIGVEISVGTSSGSAVTCEVTYTNSASSSRTAAVSIPTTTYAGDFFLLPLQAGDTGVKTITSVSLSGTMTVGTVNLVLYRPVLPLQLHTPFSISSTASLTCGGAVNVLTGAGQRIYNDSALFWIHMMNSGTSTALTSTAYNHYLSLRETHG